MDAFYASVEQRDNPELRGKPVAVGGSRERGVVAAASYEARKFGVRSAMPSITAKRQCPDLIFVKPRFDAYKAVSLQIREIFAEYTHLIEPLSLDEAYLDVTENRKGIATATEIAMELRAKIREETSLAASAGVSYNKFLAKLASDHRKPDGLFVITPQMGPAFVGHRLGSMANVSGVTQLFRLEAAALLRRRRPPGCTKVKATIIVFQRIILACSRNGVINSAFAVIARTDPPTPSPSVRGARPGPR
jgi:nucleotidyltransferase/DNA polymerase involved in DNA repair